MLMTRVGIWRITVRFQIPSSLRREKRKGRKQSSLEGENSIFIECWEDYEGLKIKRVVVAGCNAMQSAAVPIEKTTI
jgi:hypothetical protein